MDVKKRNKILNLEQHSNFAVFFNEKNEISSGADGSYFRHDYNKKVGFKVFFNTAQQSAVSGLI